MSTAQRIACTAFICLLASVQPVLYIAILLVLNTTLIDTVCLQSLQNRSVHHKVLAHTYAAVILCVSTFYEQVMLYVIVVAVCVLIVYSAASSVPKYAFKSVLESAGAITAWSYGLASLMSMGISPTSQRLLIIVSLLHAISASFTLQVRLAANILLVPVLFGAVGTMMPTKNGLVTSTLATLVGSAYCDLAGCYVHKRKELCFVATVLAFAALERARCNLFTYAID